MAEDEEERRETASASYFRLFRFASKLDILLVSIGTLAAIAHGFSNPIVIYQFGRINNAYGATTKNSAHAYHQVVELVIVIAYIGVGVIFAAFLETTCWMLAGENITANLKTKYLEALLSQDVSFYDLNVKTGDIVTAISSDMILVHDAVGEKIGAFIDSLSTFWGGIIVSLVTFWKMGLLGMSATPMLLGAGGVYIAFYSKFSAQSLTAYKEADLVTEQALSQIRTVYAFTGESKTLSTISSCLQQAVKLSLKTGLSKGMGLGFTFAVLYFSWALQFWYGGIVLKHGTIEAGTVYALILISLFGGKALGDTLRLVDPVSKGKAAAFRLFEVIDRKSMIESGQGKILETLEGSIEFCNVTFAYPSRPEVPVFDGLNLKIPQGETVALVGSSGSGKSSVVSLIQRFYDPQSGEVKINGIDIKTLQVQSLRKHMGLVSQEPALFEGTIEQNIKFGMPGASHKDVVDASKMANADGFISELPNGYDTPVGERGMQFSGGQKQRIAIARAVIRRPAILLLDEATSALDSSAESLVQKALDNVVDGQTTLVIAHRLSTIQNADKIIVLDKGRVVETGTHESLLKDGLTYASLVQLQDINSSVEKPAKEETKVVKDASMFLEAQPELGTQVSNVASWFFGLASGTWFFIILQSIGACASGLVTGFFPLFMINIIILYLKSQENDANKLILAVVGAGGIIFISNLLQYFFGHKCGAMISRKIQELSVTAVLRNEVGWFDLETNAGTAVTARISSNATIIRSVMSDTYNLFIQNAVAIVLAVVIAFICQWQVALLAFAMLPIHIGGTSVLEEFRQKGLAGDLNNYHIKAAQIAGEAASNIRTVFSLGAEEEILSGFRKRLLATKGTRLRGSALSGLTLGIMHAMMLVSSAVQLWYGISLVKKGNATFEPVLRAVSVLNYTIVSCMELLRVVPDVFKGKAAIAALFKLASRKSEIDPEKNPGDEETSQAIVGNVELVGVSFAYPTRPELPVLSELSLKVEVGDTMALVGASGSGKSSVLALIQRFYDPSAGTVLVDGKDLRSLNLKWLRQHIGFVQQEPALFGASIKENIVFGKEGASEAEVIEAAKIANAHEFISSLPEGYETQVGERGVQLSGGQKQRVAIARAVIRNPRILLLDEATSALDTEAERIVQQAIDRVILQESRSTVIVAHRLSTVHHADMIVVMENGGVVESGRHDELLANGGAYYHLLQCSSGL